MTKPENSLHFRRQKIQAEVWWEQGAHLLRLQSAPAERTGAQASRLHLEWERAGHPARKFFWTTALLALFK